jgi:hypothetical protein
VNGGYYFNNGGYYRNVDSAQRVTRNSLVNASDFDQFCVTAPSDPRLPGGGGYPICGLSNITPGKFLDVNRQQNVEAVSNYGDDKRRNHFFGVGVNARMAKGIRIGGGFDGGFQTKDQCFVVNAPGLTTYSLVAGGTGGYWGPQTTTTIAGQPTCRTTTPFKGLAMAKLNGSFPLRRGFVVSGVYQDLAGPPIEAIYAATNADVLASLGRPLAGGARSVNIPIVQAYQQYEGRIRRLDLRLTKNFTLPGKARLQANLDAYNSLNSSAIQAINNTYGAAWKTPTQVLDPRLFQVSAQLTF